MSGGDGEKRLTATVQGMVQGVGFRWFVQREATRLSLRGWVNNELDGSVAVVAEGDRADLELMVAALNEGPTGSAVRDVAARYEPARGNLDPFEIRSGGHRGD
jgi:acylphosphatase